MKEEIKKFINDNTYMNNEGDGDKLFWTTRDNGNIGDEVPGTRDIVEARRIGKLIQDKYGDTVIVKVDTCDEWVNLIVTINKN